LDLLHLFNILRNYLINYLFSGNSTGMAGDWDFMLSEIGDGEDLSQKLDNVGINLRIVEWGCDKNCQVGL